MVKKITLTLFAIGILLLGMGIAPKRTTSATISVAVESVTLAYIEPNPGIAEQLYQDWLKTEEEINKKKQIGKFNPCSCVSYAKWKSGIDVGPVGAAKNHPINSDTPRVGGLVITNESGAGHIAVITQVWIETIVITESNYLPCKVGTREISKNSPIIKGYYYP